jgi:hypothetical protein
MISLDSGGRTDQKCLQRSRRDLDKNSFESQDPNTAFIIRNIEDKMHYGEKPLGDANEWHQNKFSI